MATQLWEMDACELARLVGARLASCREVIEAHLARIDEVNPAINALAVVLGEEARVAADAADAAIGAAARRGDPIGPLSGVPMTVKENVDVAGSATTLGLAMLRDAVAAADAPHIGELRTAGAIPVGRGNMPEFDRSGH